MPIYESFPVFLSNRIYTAKCTANFTANCTAKRAKIAAHPVVLNLAIEAEYIQIYFVHR